MKMEKKILNLTQHSPSAEQIEAGVFDPPTAIKEEVRNLLTFVDLPSGSEIGERASHLAALAAEQGAKAAMIGGAPYLMGPLETALKVRGITPLYAFTVRESKEEVLPDGSTRKVAVFRHLGFVEAVP